MKDKRIWKVSHDTADFSDADIKLNLEKGIISVHKDTSGKGRSSESQGYAFTNKAAKGDLFFLCHGNQKILLIGKLTSDLIDYDEEGWAYREYTKLFDSIKPGGYSGNNRWWTPNNNSTFIEIPPKYYQDFEKDLLIPFFGITLQQLFMGDSYMERIEEYTALLKENYNLVLHGAPGTGKTFLAKEIAKSMGAEVGFCQFHPSFDYTDFVEGLRPNKGGTFDRIDGIFKEFCACAIENKREAGSFQDEADTANTGVERVDEKELFSQYCSFLENKSVESDEGLLPFHNKMQIRRICRNKKGEPKSIEIATSAESNASQTLSSEIFFRDYSKFTEGKITSYSDIKPAFESTQKFHGNAVYYYALFQRIKEFEESKDYSKTPLNNERPKPSPKKFVFIIDEINRGELSKIFGELFFSIDPGYRGLDENGNPRGLVTTQYQNLVEEDDVFAEGFYIPDNVYIIGTMNDIDRSVESMDFAMRRRFIFKEVTAAESAENMKLTEENKKAMKRINDKISETEGLNSAYHIGGAYFREATDLQKLWDLKLSSLVREYLRGIDDDGSKFKGIKTAFFKTGPDSDTSDAETEDQSEA